MLGVIDPLPLAIFDKVNLDTPNNTAALPILN